MIGGTQVQMVENMLEKEFSEIFQKLTTYKVKLECRFALLTDDSFTLYKDIHLQNEYLKLEMGRIDFVDLGIVL